MTPGAEVTLDDTCAMAFQPVEKNRVGDEPVFHHLGIAGEKCAPRQGLERVEIGQNQSRLMETADKVLAPGGIDSGLAAHRAVDLGKQGGWDLREIDAAQQHACCKAG